MTEFDDTAAVERAIHDSLLHAYGLSPRSTVTLLAVSENANFAVYDPDTNFHGVIRIHRDGYHLKEEIQSELEWMSAIRRDTDLRIPSPIATADGQLVTSLQVDASPKRHAAMFTRVGGQNLTLADATPAVYRRLGSMSAQLHQHALEWRRPPGFRRYSWDLDSMLSPRARFGHWANHPQLTHDDRRVLGRAALVVDERLRRFSAEPGTIGLAHTDLHVLNLMVDGDDLWVIDFDDCGISWYLQDIAPALACFEHGPIIDELRESWIDGYQSRRPLASSHRVVLPDFVMLRRLLLLGWSATHPRTQVPGFDVDIIVDVTITAADAYLSGVARSGTNLA